MSELNDQQQEYQEGQLPQDFESQVKPSLKRDRSQSPKSNNSSDVIYVVENSKQHKKKQKKKQKTLDKVNKSKNSSKKLVPPLTNVKQLQKISIENSTIPINNFPYQQPQANYGQSFYNNMHYRLPPTPQIHPDPNQYRRFQPHPQPQPQHINIHPQYYNYTHNPLNQPYQIHQNSQNPQPMNYYNPQIHSQQFNHQYQKQQNSVMFMKPNSHFIDNALNNQTIMRENSIKTKVQLNKILQGLTNKQDIINIVLNFVTKRQKIDFQQLIGTCKQDEDWKKLLQVFNYLKIQQGISKIKEKRLQKRLFNDAKLSIQKYSKQAQQRKRRDPRLKN